MDLNSQNAWAVDEAPGKRVLMLLSISVVCGEMLAVLDSVLKLDGYGVGRYP